MSLMKHIAFAITLALTPFASVAEEQSNKDIEEGSTLLEQGARLLLKGLMSEMEPALEDMTKELENFALNAEPILRELSQMMGDITNYHPPEILPNGDIIIRRKLPGEVAPDGKIDI